MRNVVVVAHNIRSSHNVGSLLRTADGLGVRHVYLTGYTPYPKTTDDKRLPHISKKSTAQIAKTALGAEKLPIWSYREDIKSCLDELHKQGYTIVGLEQDERAQPITALLKSTDQIALLLGNEVDGILPELRELCDCIIELPMHGKKESYNVSIAAAMALYHITQL